VSTLAGVADESVSIDLLDAGSDGILVVDFEVVGKGAFDVFFDDHEGETLLLEALVLGD